MRLNLKDDILNITKDWKGERFEDGRPKVDDRYLEMLASMTLEEIWLPLYIKGYRFQFEGGLKTLHSGMKLIGRAVTCTFMPTRPDLFDLVKGTGDNNGWKGTCNQWVIDSLVMGDVVVADMFDKVYNGTFVGGNLTTAIAAKTKTGGAVIWGGIRDIEQMAKIKDTQVFYRGVDPTPIREVVMTGFNSVCRLGGAICLPGDVVFGTTSGVLFIPSHMIAECINSAKKSHVKDIFGFEMIEKGIYTTAQIDSSVWTLEMLERMKRFIIIDSRCEEYRGLDWNLEIDAAKGEPGALDEVLKTCLV